jgi:hypothetical protein
MTKGIIEMIRNLKVLGLALVAVLALGALMASVASAGKLTVTSPETEPFPVKLHAEQVAGENHVFTLTDDENLEVKCPTATFAGTQNENTSSTVQVHPTYTEGGGEKCKGFLGINATVNTATCDYVFHIGETVGSEGHYGGTVDIVKAGEAACGIVVTAATCQVTVDAQNGLSALTGINMPNGEATDDVTVKAEIQNIHYTVTNDGLFCPLKNGQTTGVKGDYVGNTTVQGTDANGNPANLFIEM